jgi:hypothetical protein
MEEDEEFTSFYSLPCLATLTLSSAASTGRGTSSSRRRVHRGSAFNYALSGDPCLRAPPGSANWAATGGANVANSATDCDSAAPLDGACNKACLGLYAPSRVRSIPPLTPMLAALAARLPGLLRHVVLSRLVCNVCRAARRCPNNRPGIIPSKTKTSQTTCFHIRPGGPPKIAPVSFYHRVGGHVGRHVILLFGK